MPSQATVTAKTGPAVQSTALVVTNIVWFSVDLEKRVIQARLSDQPWRVIDYDLVGVTTFTISISGSSYTMVIS